MVLRRVHPDSGMTLIEIIAVIAVMGILSGVVAHAVAYWNGVGRKTHQLLLREQQVSAAMSRLINGTRGVEGLMSAVAFSMPDDTELTYTQTVGTQVRYFLQSAGTSCNGVADSSTSKLCTQVGAAQAAVVADAIDSFSVHRDGNLATISISSIVTGTGGPRAVELTTSVKPRNIP